MNLVGIAYYKIFKIFFKFLKFQMDNYINLNLIIIRVKFN